ncbi:hypothetical protein ABPG72_007618 [Tetrahymena utriculariae]
MLPNIDQFLEQLRLDKLHIDERSKERQEQYSKATQLYLKSVQNEMNTLDRTSQAHQLRNKEFRNQIKDVYSRYLANSYRIIKSQKKTVAEKIYLNDFLVLAYPDYADKQKVQMEKKKSQLERRLETLKDLNRKENINFYEIMNQKYESFEYLDQIKAKREQLEREVLETKKMLKKASSQADLETDKRYMKEFKDLYGTEYYDQKPPIPKPVQEKFIQPKKSERDLIDDFLLPSGKDYDRKFFSSHQPDFKEVKNLQQYITQNNPPKPQGINDLPKQSMLDKFIMKGSPQNLNGSFRVIPSVRVEDPKKTLSAQRNRHNNSAVGFGNTGQINFEDSRENSPDQNYQPNINISPGKPPRGNYTQIPRSNIDNINLPQPKKNEIYYSSKKKLE